MREMRRILIAAAALFIVFFAVSCVTEADPTGLKGVWKASDGEYDYTFTFTSDGFYASEIYYEDYLEYAEFGTFESDESYIYTDLDDYPFSWDGSNLVLDYFGSDLVFKRTSKTARNNTSASKLCGVWSGQAGVAGFTKGGTFSSMGLRTNIDDYSADGTVLTIGGTENNYLIINSRLYIRDEDSIFGANYTVIFDRETSGGEDQTSREILTLNNPWHLTDMDEGTNHYIYEFSSSGNYTMEYYNDNYSDHSKSSGTYRYSGHTIELSDDGDLAYLIVDLRPFMFSI